MPDVCRRVAALTDATVQFGHITDDHWIQPSWINETKASAARDSMAKNGVIYGGILSTLIPCMSVNACNHNREPSVRAIPVKVEIACSRFPDIGICVASTPEYVFTASSMLTCTEPVDLWSSFIGTSFLSHTNIIGGIYTTHSASFLRLIICRVE